MLQDDDLRQGPLLEVAAIRDNTEAELTCIIALARKTFDVAIALVTLIDNHTSWFDARPGDDVSSITKDGSLFTLTPGDGETLVISDAAQDPRFAGKGRAVDSIPIRFYSETPLWLEPGTQIGTLYLIDTKPRPFQADQEQLLGNLSGVIEALIRGSVHARMVHVLRREVAQKAQLAQKHQALMARYKKMYDSSSTRAKIGVWECDLETEELTWTDGVYDIFELERGSSVTREKILDLYYQTSRKEMKRLRSRAIQERGSFSLDIRIRTAKGNKRWVRLSADVECDNGLAPSRIFGLKQDITQERELWERMRILAEYDPLTELANRSVFDADLLKSLSCQDNSTALAALMLVDLDGFKDINDTFGHAAGDECLRQIARRLRRVFKRAKLVARIGGDEFAILISGSRDQTKIENDAQILIEEIACPIFWEGQPFSVGASIGISIPADHKSCSPSTIFAEADSALYAAKRSGRNAFRSFDSTLNPKADFRCFSLGSPA